MGQGSQVMHVDHVNGSHAPLNAQSQVLARELINDVTGACSIVCVSVFLFERIDA